MPQRKTMASGNKFVEEIYDQVLLCQICFETYRTPKTLSCLHTFCSDCLEQYMDAEAERSRRYLFYTRPVTCPICRKKTDLPSGGVRRLPDNFLLSSLTQILHWKKVNGSSDKPSCEICTPGSVAKSRCLDCNKILCQACVDLHRRTKVTQSHSVYDLQAEKETLCKVHPEDVVRFYCEPCTTCVCVVCTFQEHRGHDVVSFAEGIEKLRALLQPLLNTCKSRVGIMKSNLELVESCKGELKRAEEHIRDMAIDSIATVRKQEKEMLLQLHGSFGDDALEYLKQQDQMQETLEELQETCNLTEIVFQEDQGVELLLMKKDLQEKMNNMLKTQLVTAPPKTLANKVTFIPGKFVFGHLDTGLKSQQQLQTPPQEMRPESSQRANELAKKYCDRQSQTILIQEPLTTARSAAVSNEGKQGREKVLMLDKQTLTTQQVSLSDKSVLTEKVGSDDKCVGTITPDESTKIPATRDAETIFEDLSVVLTDVDEVATNQRRPSRGGATANFIKTLERQKSTEGVGGAANVKKIGTNMTLPFSNSSPALATPLKSSTSSKSGGTISRGVGTGNVEVKERGVLATVTSVNSATTMPHVYYLEKETCTPQLHVLHKNVSTENTGTCDKQTSTVQDIRAAYMGAVSSAHVRPHMVSRGTCT